MMTICYIIVALKNQTGQFKIAEVDVKDANAAFTDNLKKEVSNVFTSNSNSLIVFL